MVEWTDHGQITRFKLVRRQIYGRGKIDLLKAKLMNCIKIAVAPIPTPIDTQRILLTTFGQRRETMMLKTNGFEALERSRLMRL